MINMTKSCLCLCTLVTTCLFLRCVQAESPTQDKRGSDVPDQQKLLVVLTDGFRWDYEYKYGLGNFTRLSQEGAKAGYFMNDYPTLSYPNYYSIMTGLHAESHSMSGNFMYDMRRQEYFLIGTNKAQFHSHWWNAGQPLWITAIKQNQTSYLWHMPGCEVEIQDTRPTYCEAYSTVTTTDVFRTSLHTALEVLINGTTRLSVVYHEQPDNLGHLFGPDSEEIAQTLREIDTELGRLLDRLKNRKDVNLIWLSDHGMTSVTDKKVVNISSALSDGDYVTIMENGAIAYIYTDGDERKEKVYAALDGFHPNMVCYKKEDIPERLHLRRGAYVSQIMCKADLGWTIVQPYGKFINFPGKGDWNLRGHHGYDNEEEDMRGIFYAYGPLFRSGGRVEYLRAVDPYNLMCTILDLSPAPNNGSTNRIQPLLLLSSVNSASLVSIGWSINMMALLITAICKINRTR